VLESAVMVSLELVLAIVSAMRFKRVTLVAGGGRYRKTQCPQTPRSASGASLILESRGVPSIDASRTHEQRERGGGNRTGRACADVYPKTQQTRDEISRIEDSFVCFLLLC
jgi:hypothetical protein